MVWPILPVARALRDLDRVLVIYAMSCAPPLDQNGIINGRNDSKKIGDELFKYERKMPQ
jgi:hypothetical protein